MRVHNSLGQEMGAYASGIRRGIKRIKSAVEVHM